MQPPRPGHFADRLHEAIQRAGSPSCVGLDPVLEKLPGQLRDLGAGEGFAQYCEGVIDAIAPAGEDPIVAAVKPQSACFERHGSEGFAALERACAVARDRGLVVILDAKRGDIGISAEHYAQSAARLGSHAVTVNAYLGPKTVHPYLDAHLGVFVLVRTTNEDSATVQSLELADGRTVAQMMADHVAILGEERYGQSSYSDVGAVVGAQVGRNAEEARKLRWRLPRHFFLVPGYGAQGGTNAEIRNLMDEDGGGVLATASRSVIYAFAKEPDESDWRVSVANAANRFAGELKELK